MILYTNMGQESFLIIPQWTLFILPAQYPFHFLSSDSPSSTSMAYGLEDISSPQLPQKSVIQAQIQLMALALGQRFLSSRVRNKPQVGLVRAILSYP